MRASAGSVSPNAKQVILLAGEAESGALRIQALLPAHISEESDQKMDAMESSMTAEDRQVRKNLDELVVLVDPTESGDLHAAVAAYTRFNELRKQILEFSRENTNVRSLDHLTEPQASDRTKVRGRIGCPRAGHTEGTSPRASPKPSVAIGSSGSPVCKPRLRHLELPPGK